MKDEKRLLFMEIRNRLSKLDVIFYILGKLIKGLKFIFNC